MEKMDLVVYEKKNMGIVKASEKDIDEKNSGYSSGKSALKAEMTEEGMYEVR